MKRKKDEPEVPLAEYEAKLHKPHGEAIAAASLAGVAAGAAVGAVVGPVGAVVGGMIGAAVGSAAGEIIQEENERTSFHDHELDDDIGVTKGDLGAADPKQPPPKHGLYSAASAGVGSSGTAPAEGPMQDLDE
jgi:phage tail tape-measure protein